MYKSGWLRPTENSPLACPTPPKVLEPPLSAPPPGHGPHDPISLITVTGPKSALSMLNCSETFILTRDVEFLPKEVLYVFRILAQVPIQKALTLAKEMWFLLRCVIFDQLFVRFFLIINKTRGEQHT